MDAMTDMVMEKTGLTRDKTSKAVQLTVDYIKQRVPSATASRIDGILVGEAVSKTAEEVKGKIEGAFRR